MTATFTWVFPNFEVAPSENSLSNIVRTIHWRLISTLDGYSSEAYGSITLDQPNPDSFTDFQSLTKELVTDWVIAKLSESDPDAVDKLKNALLENIEKQKAPPIVTMQAPF